MPHYIINYSSWTDQAREPYEDDGWDRGDTSTTHSITGFTIVKDDDDFFDGTMSFEPEHERPYFLLYITYGDGDSFGRDDGNIMFIDIFENMETAELNVQRIYGHGDDYSITLFAEYEEGKLTKYEISAPWVGYFNCLQEVHIEKIWRQPN